jgi:hypothetical protein
MPAGLAVTGFIPSSVTGRKPDVNLPGNSYTVVNGGFNISNNRAIGTAVGTNDAVIDTGLSDATISAQMYAPTSAGGAGLIFRETDASNYWLAQWDVGGGAFTLFKRVAGTPTTLCTTGIGSALVSAGAGREIPIEVLITGSSIRVLLHGVSICTVTDSFNSTATKHGINLFGTTATIDDLKIQP